MLVCKATKEHYERLIKDGWKDKYNNIKNKNCAFEISLNRQDKEIYFYPIDSGYSSFEHMFLGDRQYDIIELIDNDWVYVQKYEDVTNSDIKLICNELK